MQTSSARGVLLLGMPRIVGCVLSFRRSTPPEIAGEEGCLVRYKLAYCALGLLTVALSVSAQEGLRDRERGFSASQQISTDLRKARFRSGAFYLLSSINLSDIGYESSFFVPTPERGSGISFGFSAPNRLYYVPSKKAVFSVQATPEYTFFTGGSGNGR